MSVDFPLPTSAGQQPQCILFQYPFHPGQGLPVCGCLVELMSFHVPPERQLFKSPFLLRRHLRSPRFVSENRSGDSSTATCLRQLSAAWKKDTCSEAHLSLFTVEATLRS